MTGTAVFPDRFPHEWPPLSRHSSCTPARARYRDTHNQTVLVGWCRISTPARVNPGFVAEAILINLHAFEANISGVDLPQLAHPAFK